MHKGAAIATGSILVFFDDDDIPAPRYLEEITKAFECSSYDIISTFCQAFEANEQDHKEYLHVSMAIGGSVYPNLYCNFFGKGCFGVRSSAFRLIGGFTHDETILPFVDYRFYLKAAINDLEIGILPRALYGYRTSSSNSLFKESSKVEKLFKVKSQIADIVTSGGGEYLKDLSCYFIMNTSLPHL
jgi:Glycosyltransferases, probably involved in cell wall biogenesis